MLAYISYWNQHSLSKFTIEALPVLHRLVNITPKYPVPQKIAILFYGGFILDWV